MQNQIPRIISFRFCPLRQQRLHQIAHRALMIAHAINLDERRQNRKRTGRFPRRTGSPRPQFAPPTPPAGTARSCRPHIRAQQLLESFQIRRSNFLGGSIRPRSSNPNVRPFRRQFRQRQISPRENSRGIIGTKRDLVRVGEFFQFSVKPRQLSVGFFHADQHAVARFPPRRVMQAFHLRDRPAGKQSSHVNHFVRLRRGKNALQAARPGPLLHHKRNGQRPIDLRRINPTQHLQHCRGPETIADRSAGHFPVAQLHQPAIDDDRIQNIHARLARFFRGHRADIHINILDVAGARRIAPARLQMHR